MVDEKKCPYCAEIIKAEAIVCRFCGSELTTPASVHQSVSNQNSLKKTKGQNKSAIFVLIIIFLCIFFWAIGQLGQESVSSPGRNNSSSSTVYAKDFVTTTKDDWDCSHDSIGNMIIEGKVKNTSTIYDLQFVQLRGIITDRNGQIVNTNTSYIDSDILYAKSTSTFTIYVDDPDNQASRCRVEVEDAYFK